MYNDKLKELELCAIESIITCTSQKNEITMNSIIDKPRLYIAASMDIKKTTESLNQILEYKKEAAKQMLQCENEKQINYFADLIKQADNMIKLVLGIY